MFELSGIITVGISPCRDITYYASGVEWGKHCVVDKCTYAAAGKALNVSRSLAWLGVPSTAGGLWGRDDLEKAKREADSWGGLVKAKFTPADGQTRQNFTLVDTSGQREIHLRAKSVLADDDSLRALREDMEKTVRPGNAVVFAGSIPAGKPVEAVLEIVKVCGERGAKTIVDTSGEALEALVESGQVWLAKPNVAELAELAGMEVKDDEAVIAGVCAKMKDKCRNFLVSRGAKGAVLVCEEGIFSAHYPGKVEVLRTVAAGDFMLGGFLAGIGEGQGLEYALDKSVRTATARVMGLSEKMPWDEANQELLNCTVEKYPF